VEISLLNRILFGTDGIGPLGIALLDECFDSQANAGQVRSGRVFDEVDLSAEGSEFTLNLILYPTAFTT